MSVVAFEIPKVTYTGKIKTVKLGKGPKAVSVGGETAYPFHLFEGEMPHAPRIAMEVYDVPPEEWPEAALEPFKDVANDPVAWAKKCVQSYGAEMIALQLVSTDPNGLNRSADEAAQTAKKVAAAVDVPVIVWGSGNTEKDADVLRKVAETCDGMNLIIGPVAEGNYKQVGAGAIGYKHTAIASTPIDINLAKQLNILMEIWASQMNKSSSTQPPVDWDMELNIPIQSWNEIGWPPSPNRMKGSNSRFFAIWPRRSGKPRRLRRRPKMLRP